jgi:hypothetical protein
VSHRLAQVAAIGSPLERLQRAAALGRELDEYRSSVADAKGQAALECSKAGITQAQMAEACGVHPAMAQQWVRRGRGLPAH